VLFIILYKVVPSVDVACSRRSDGGALTINIESRGKKRPEETEGGGLSPQCLLVFTPLSIFFISRARAI